MWKNLANRHPQQQTLNYARLSADIICFMTNHPQLQMNGLIPLIDDHKNNLNRIFPGPVAPCMCGKFCEIQSLLLEFSLKF